MQVDMKFIPFHFPNLHRGLGDTVGEAINLKLLGKCFGKNIVIMGYTNSLDTYRDIVGPAFGFTKQDTEVLTITPFHTGVFTHKLSWVAENIKRSNAYDDGVFNRLSIPIDDLPIGLCKFVTKKLLEEGIPW